MKQKEDIGCGTAIALVIAILFIIAIATAWTGWLVMLFVGLLHSWNSDIPTMSYTISLVVGFFVNAVFSGGFNISSTNK